MVGLIDKAYEFASAKHFGQVDDSGIPYMCHPINVAKIIADVSKDVQLVCAAYLHDTIEDTDTTYDELADIFGKEIADIVMEVTHDGAKDARGYYFPRLKTQKGIMLKFADRLDNLSRMESWTEERRQHYLKKSKFWKSE